MEDPKSKVLKNATSLTHSLDASVRGVKERGSRNRRHYVLCITPDFPDKEMLSTSTIIQRLPCIEFRLGTFQSPRAEGSTAGLQRLKD